MNRFFFLFLISFRVCEGISLSLSVSLFHYIFWKLNIVNMPGGYLSCNWLLLCNWTFTAGEPSFECLSAIGSISFGFDNLPPVPTSFDLGADLGGEEGAESWPSSPPSCQIYCNRFHPFLQSSRRFSKILVAWVAMATAETLID